MWLARELTLVGQAALAGSDTRRFRVNSVSTVILNCCSETWPVVGVVLSHEAHEVLVDAERRAHVDLLVSEQRVAFGHDQIRGGLVPLAEARRGVASRASACRIESVYQSGGYFFACMVIRVLVDPTRARAVGPARKKTSPPSRRTGPGSLGAT